MKTHMKKYVWLAAVGVGVLCFAIFYYMFVYRFSWDLDDGTLTISGKEEMPDYYDIKRVPWYSERDKIVEVIIEDGVTRIGGWAFEGCSNLTSITIPESVTEIGVLAFDSCCSLTSITIPKSVTEISKFAFKDCSALNSVYITDIKSWCKIDFGDEESNPLSQALHFYLNGKEVNDLVIPNGVTKIGDYAFAGYSGITSVTIPSSVTEIGGRAFKGCSGLTSITIPSSVKYIGKEAFAGCLGLTSITIPSSVEEIGTYAFDGCTGLTSVHITDLLSWCRIDFNTFMDRPYRELYANPLYSAKHLYLNGKEINDLVIPNGVTEIKNYAFEGCSELKSVTIPASVKKIGHVAFSDCSGLKSVTIPKSVKEIGDCAFWGCSGLRSITIPNSVKEIGRSAFKGCSGLTSVTIPYSVKEIGDCAFWGCSGLRYITCKARTPPKIESDESLIYSTFDGVEESIPVYVPFVSVEAYKKADGWKEFTNIKAIE